VQRQWLEEHGVDVQLHRLEWGTLVSRLKAGDFDLARYSWCADFPDPVAFLVLAETGASANYGQFHNQAFDDALRRARSSRTLDQRNAALQDAEAQVLRLMPIVPLFHGRRTSLLNPKVGGIRGNREGLHPLKYVHPAKQPPRPR